MAAKDASSSPAASSSATTSLPKHANNDRKGKEQWSVTVFAVPVAIAILVLFALSYLGNGGFTPAALWLPSFGLREPGSHHAGDLDAGDLLADFALHPEDHIYREPINHYLQWHITAEDRRPDGVKKKVYLINGTNGLVFIMTKTAPRRVCLTLSRPIPGSYHRGTFG